MMGRAFHNVTFDWVNVLSGRHRNVPFSAMSSGPDEERASINEGRIVQARAMTP